MAWSNYNEFLEAARELYALDLEDARQLYRDMRDLIGGTPDVEALLELPDEVSDAVFEYHRDDAPESADVDDASEFELDPYFPDDEWLDAGVEWEMTADYLSEEG